MPCGSFLGTNPMLRSVKPILGPDSRHGTWCFPRNVNAARGEFSSAAVWSPGPGPRASVGGKEICYHATMCISSIQPSGGPPPDGTYVDVVTLARDLRHLAGTRESRGLG